MAQLMAYYKWPDKGHGERYGDGIWSDEGTFIGYTDTLRIDEIPIDWDNMCNTYNGNETQAQQIAVATLMRLCGETCGVSYHSSSSGSAANGYAPYEALTKYFYYKGERNDATNINGHSEAEWHDYLYNALSQNKPIICWGTGGAGHEYIMDGYDGKGYFHFNWGWGGNKDGFYKLKGALYSLYYIFIMEPDYEKTGIEEDTSVLHRDYLIVWSQTGDSGRKYKGKNGDDDWVSLAIFYKPGDGISVCNVQVGLNIINSEGENKIISVYQMDENGQVITEGAGFGQTPVSYLKELASQCNLEDGEYKCYQVYKRNGENEWHDSAIYWLWSPTYIRLIVEDGEMTFLTPYPSVSVESDRTIRVRRATSLNTNIYNTYGMRVYSGKDEEIKVTSPGIYTVIIGNELIDYIFKKTIVVK